MTKEQLNLLSNTNNELQREKFIENAITALRSKNDHTLIWGYTVDRESFHVYLKDGVIYKVIYDYKCEPVNLPVNSMYDVIPCKRAYPEACDYDFCRYIKAIGGAIPFTGYNEEREEKQFHGEVLPEHQIV